MKRICRTFAPLVFIALVILSATVVPAGTVGAAFIQQPPSSAALIPGDGAAKDGFGYALAYSADGSTAVVGAFGKNKVGNSSGTGAIYLYTKGAGGWTLKQETTAITANIANGIEALAAGDEFGFSVASSADGSSILVGADQRGTANRGKAYLFVTADHTTWSVQNEFKPAGMGTGDLFGFSVALNGSGQTALIGAQTTSTVYVYTGNPLATTATTTLTGGAGSCFGSSVTLSLTTSAGLIGAPCDQTGTGGGAAYFYGNGFGAAPQKLQPTGLTGAPAFGTSVALSPDATTALVGAPYDGNLNPNGAVFAYFGTGTTFNTMTAQRIDPTDTVPPDYTGGYFGTSLALSGDGSIAVIGETEGAVSTTNPTTNPGSVHVYHKVGSTFDAANKQVLFASDRADQSFFGSALGLSQDGVTLLVGAQLAHGTGQVYDFALFPDLAPPAGALTGGTVGTMYPGQQFTGSGGAGGPYRYTSTGTLPPGLNLAPTTGLLSGTPTTAGNYTFSVSVMDTANATTTQAYTLVVAPGATVTTVTPATVAFSAAAQNLILNATVMNGVPVNEGTVTFTVSQSGGTIGTPVTSGTVTNGTATATFALPANTPAGAYTATAVYNPATTNPNFLTSMGTGTLTVMPDATSIIVAAANAPFSSMAQNITLNATVSSTNPVSEGTVTFSVKQGTTTIGVSVTSTTLVNGAASATFILPANTAAGAYTVTAAYNPAMPTPDFLTSTGTGTLTVNAATLTLNPLMLPNGTVGTPYPTQTLSASGGNGTDTFRVTSGTLPSGLMLNMNSGVIIGTPTVAGANTFTVTVQDTAGNSGTRNYTVTITAATLPAITVTAPSGSGNGNSGSGTMPIVRPGTSLTLSAQLAIGGTPTGVMYQSSNPTVVAVDPNTGVLTGIAAGQATITVTAANGTPGTIIVAVSMATGGGLMNPNPQPMTHSTGSASGSTPAAQPGRAPDGSTGSNGPQPQRTGNTRPETPTARPEAVRH